MLVSFILTIAILVTVHEYGHLQAARWCGVPVLKFSIGFGKPLWSKKFGKDQTEFVIAAIPLGGFVKMLDEREFNQDETNLLPVSEAQLSRAFNRQPVTKRIAIVLAGPVANLLLAILLYCMLFMQGVVGLKPTIAEVAPQSPAALAGFVIGETVQSVNGRSVASWQDFHWLLLKESLVHERVEVRAITTPEHQKIHQLSLSSMRNAQADKDAFSSLGLSPVQVLMPARIGEIVADSPAYTADLQVDDLILSVDKQTVANWQDFVAYVRSHAGQVLTVLVLRKGAEMQIKLQPGVRMEQGLEIGHIGAAVKMESNAFVVQRYGFSAAMVKAVEKTWDTAIFSLQMLLKMITGQASWQGVGGPVTIATYAGQSADMGFKVFIGFLALVSISIGVLNLLPIPVLDGGHLMYYMVEILTGKPIHESVMAVGQKIGLALLGLMMMIAFYNDINRLITG